MMFSVFFGLFVAALIGSANSAGRVCSKMIDYSIPFSKNCWIDLNVGEKTTVIVVRDGYHILEYKVTTQDGYILDLYRIRAKKNVYPEEADLQSVLLMHGQFTSSQWFFTHGNDSLAYHLANSDFDVWVGNSRGTAYSRKHTTLSIKSKAYWNFTFHEAALYDISAYLEQIKLETNRSDTIYVGVSSGATQFFVYSSLLQEHAMEHVETFVGIAPITTLKRWKSPYKLFARPALMLKPLIYFFKPTKIPSNDGAQKLLKKIVCHGYLGKYFCLRLLNLAYGFDDKQFMPETLPAFLAYYPSGISTKNLIHWYQIMTSKQFRQYDYGKKKNVEVYGQTAPPSYDLSAIQIPTFIISAPNDWLAPREDINELARNLRNDTLLGMFEVQYANFNHYDFAYGRNATELFVKPLIDILKNSSTK